MKKILSFLLFLYCCNIKAQEYISPPPSVHLAFQTNGKGVKFQSYFVYENFAIGIGTTKYTISSDKKDYANSPYDIGKSFFITGGFDIRDHKTVSLSIFSGISFTDYLHAENIRISQPTNLLFVQIPSQYEYDLKSYQLIGAHLNLSINFNFTKYTSFQFGLNKEFHKFKNPTRFIIGIKMNLPLKEN